MASCTTIRPKKRKLCIGDLNIKITIKTRTITAPKNGSVDFDIDFNNDVEVWAALETKSGVEIFDGVNLIGKATHYFYIRYIADFEINDWVQYNNEYYDLIDFENLDGKNEWLRLRCSKRGNDSLNANFSR